ncbi:MAG: serine/threonine protein kinase [Actinomycetota bacterium]|nr:serine/threonine protein kinase [Actinomycetota bacterium]
MAPAPGMSLGQRYELRSLIATGGMGQVWRAEDSTLHRAVAVKVLRSEFTGDATFLARFRAEARNTAALSHPNIASIYDYGEADQAGEHVAYLVMELVDGEPLSEVLVREGRLAPERTLHILAQAAAGLNAAHHSGVVHRDIKPGNLLVRPDGTVKVTDFGIARATSTVPLTQTGMVVGTAHYLSPEQAEGRVTTPASDVYSLGIVGYECLAGQRPFDGASSVAVALKQIRETPPPLPSDVPQPVRELIDRALSKDARLRFPTGGEFATAITAVREGRRIAPGPSSGPSVTTDVGTQVIGVPHPGVAVPAAAAAGLAGAGAADAAPPRGPGTQVMHGAGPPGAEPPSVIRPPAARRPPPEDSPPRNTGWWLLLGLALVVLAGVIGLVVAQNLDTSDTPEQTTGPTVTTEQTTTEQTTAEQTTTEATTTEQTTTEPPPEEETVNLNPADYVGRDIDTVTDELEELGFEVNPDPMETNQFPPGTVGQIDPSGEQEVGTEITVPYAVPVENGDGDGNGNGGGRGGGNG